MKKRKKGHRFRTRANNQLSQRRTNELEPEELAACVRRAEKDVLPVIKEMQLGPGTAYFLLAQQTQVLITSDPRLTIESAMDIMSGVLALWQAGYYTPGSEYPFTLEETLQDVLEGPQAKGNYDGFFLPYIPIGGDAPHGLGTVYGGIVRHPETNLWQSWLMLDGPCTFISAYHDPIQAQNNLEDIINASRKGGSVAEGAAFYKWMQSRSDSEPKQLPYDMMLYLVDHMDDFVIKL